MTQFWIPDPTVERLRTKARARGLSVETYVQSVLESDAQTTDVSTTSAQTMSAEDRWTLWERELAELASSVQFGQIPATAFDPNVLYEERG